MYMNGICFITDRDSCSVPVYEAAFAVLKAGVTFVQYRRKDGSRREIYDEAVKFRKLTRHFNATFIVNDHADIALAVDADGVHLGQEDLPLKEARRIMGKKIVGISTHDLSQAREAEAGGADYIGFGPLFHTATKDAGAPRGTEGLAEICRRVNIPVVAIGGITLDTVEEVVHAGAGAVAVASALCRGDAAANAGRFVDLMHKMQDSHTRDRRGAE